MDRLFVLLQQEGYLFRACLGGGLTALRKADLNDPGRYYTAFFELSIGFERLLKSILIIEHLSVHGAAPTEAELRRFGHDVMGLLAATSTGSTAASLATRQAVTDAVTHEILVFLSGFARGSRYFNLNALAGAGGIKDPIEEWDRIVLLILMDVGSTASALLDAPTRLSGTALNMARAFRLRRAQELASSHAVARLVRILATLRERLGEVVDAASKATVVKEAVPYMIEFLNFTYGSDAENRRRKRWP